MQEARTVDREADSLSEVLVRLSDRVLAILEELGDGNRRRVTLDDGRLLLLLVCLLLLCSHGVSYKLPLVRKWAAVWSSKGVRDRLALLLVCGNAVWSAADDTPKHCKPARTCCAVHRLLLLAHFVILVVLVCFVVLTTAVLSLVPELELRELRSRRRCFAVRSRLRCWSRRGSSHGVESQVRWIVCSAAGTDFCPDCTASFALSERKVRAEAGAEAARGAALGRPTSAARLELSPVEIGTASRATMMLRNEIPVA